MIVDLRVQLAMMIWMMTATQSLRQIPPRCRSSATLKGKNAAIEEENICPKLWSLRDEVSTSTHSQDGLLETSIEHNKKVR